MRKICFSSQTDETAPSISRALAKSCPIGFSTITREKGLPGSSRPSSPAASSCLTQGTISLGGTDR